jgi:hypothetical protein
MKSQFTAARLFIVVSFMVASGASIRTVVSAGWGDLKQSNARWEIAAWQSRGNFPSPTDWGRVRDSLEDAKAFVPEDPNVTETLGYLLQMRALRLHQFPDLIEPILLDSSSYFRESTRLRPMAPHAWLNYALSLYLLGARDDSLSSAYKRALLYGKRDPQIKAQLNNIAFLRSNEIEAKWKVDILRKYESRYEDSARLK